MPYLLENIREREYNFSCEGMRKEVYFSLVSVLREKGRKFMAELTEATYPQDYISSGGLIQFLHNNTTQKWTNFHHEKTLIETYNALCARLYGAQKESVIGALKQSYDDVIANVKKMISEERIDEAKEVLDECSFDYLNDHGPDHINMVIERADDILKSAADGAKLTVYEAFILLCAIQIHDIGNIKGRSEHEKKSICIFDEIAKDVILDTYERKVIKIIAKAHGGRTSNGSKNTLLALPEIDQINQQNIRIRFLAAVLRFADELADDATRANKIASNFKLLSESSEIYHAYSESLKSVLIQKDTNRGDSSVALKYYYETEGIEKKYKCIGGEKYLLDEIYDRTLKMERERIYFMRFARPYIDISKIVVTIGREDGELEDLGQSFQDIHYTLEDKFFPEEPVRSSQWLYDEVPTGESQYADYLRRKGCKNE